MGYSSLATNTTGSANTSIGYQALGFNTTGSNNTAVGAQADVSTTLSWSTALGASAVANASNKVRIGDPTVTVVEGQVAYSFPSDGRFKYNVNDEDVKGLDFIKRLRPVVYNFDTKKFDEFLIKDMPDEVKKAHLSGRDYTPSSAVRQSGFIAQEVEKAMQESGYNFNGVHTPVNESDNYSIAYSQFVVPLVKGMQEQQTMIENQQTMIQDQRKAIAELKKQNELMQKEIELLKKK